MKVQSLSKRSNGSVKAAIVMVKSNCELKDAEVLLQEAGGSLRKN